MFFLAVVFDSLLRLKFSLTCKLSISESGFPIKFKVGCFLKVTVTGYYSLVSKFGHNCREHVVTVVRVVFATKWKHEDKSCRDTLATVHDNTTVSSR